MNDDKKAPKKKPSSVRHLLLKQLQEEVTDLTRNLNALEKELNDTNSKLRKALR